MALDAGTLRVVLQYAQNLKDQDWFGKQDPYAKVRVGTQERRSRTAIDGGRHPVWNETFEFNIINENSLDIVLWDEDTFSRDDLIGSCSVSLARAREGHGIVITEQVPVQCKHHHRQRGFVQVQLSFHSNSKLRPQSAAYAPPYSAPPPTYGYAPPAYGYASTPAYPSYAPAAPAPAYPYGAPAPAPAYPHYQMPQHAPQPQPAYSPYSGGYAAAPPPASAPAYPPHQSYPPATYATAPAYPPAPVVSQSAYGAPPAPSAPPGSYYPAPPAPAPAYGGYPYRSAS